MEVELDIVLDKKEFILLKLFCDKSMKGKMTDEDWRDYQINAILGNKQTLKMDGYKKFSQNAITFVFTKSLLLGCVDDISIVTPLRLVTHVVKQVHIGNNVAKGLVTILDTQEGRIIKKLLDNGIGLSLVPRFLPNKKIYRLDII